MGTIKINLADALFSRVQQRVLGLLYSRPDCSFHTNEIIRLTDSGTGAIQRELKKLTTVGLVSIFQAGNQKNYQANPNNPLFEELRSIVLKTFGVGDLIKQGLEPIAHHISIAFIYGSVAKHEDKATSDIDLMILSDNINYSEIFPLLVNAEQQLGRSINPTCYSLKEWERKLKKDNNFLVQVMKQPKIFLIGDLNELEKLGKSGRS